MEGVLESLKRALEAEEQSEKLLQLSRDGYSNVAAYTQNLKRLVGPNNSEITNRLVARQLELIEGLVRHLLRIRIRKATSQGAVQQLLPEERFVCSVGTEFQRRTEELVGAVVGGQPSYLAAATRIEMGRSIMVRFLKPVTEIIGIDLRRYGPFKPQDLAVLPSANVDILVANGEAVVVHTRDSHHE